MVGAEARGRAAHVLHSISSIQTSLSHPQVGGRMNSLCIRAIQQLPYMLALALTVGCSGGAQSEEDGTTLQVAADSLKGGHGGKGTNSCTNAPAVTVTPNPLAAGSTSITVNGTG